MICTERRQCPNWPARRKRLRSKTTARQAGCPKVWPVPATAKKEVPRRAGALAADGSLRTGDLQRSSGHHARKMKAGDERATAADALPVGGGNGTDQNGPGHAGDDAPGLLRIPRDEGRKPSDGR